MGKIIPERKKGEGLVTGEALEGPVKKPARKPFLFQDPGSNAVHPIAENWTCVKQSKTQGPRSKTSNSPVRSFRLPRYLILCA